MGKAIGIDLGTTNSCAAVVENNQPKIIMYKGGNYTIPSMFAVDEAGNKLVGHDAKKIAQLNPASTVYGSKRLLGRNFGSKTIEKVRQLFTYEIMEGEDEEVLVKVKDQVFSLEQVSAHILDKIREVSEEYLHDEITSAVITVPAYFNERQRQAVRNAGKMAKLNVIRILNEPTAAALAYGLGKSLNQKLAVYDLGGGTFDISIIEVKDKIFEVIATGGDTMLGGIDFDNRIMEWIITSFEKEHGIDLSNNIVAVQRIKESAERAKIDLSSLEETRVSIPFIARGPKGTLNVDMLINRDILEELTRDLVERTLSTCEKVLAEAKLRLDELDEVLLVGGQSRMPLVQKRVTEFFGRQPCKGVHPDEAVAVGAAIMAHSLTDQSYHKVELLDVLPMAIGIAKVNGSLLRLFPKFSPIPSYKSLILTNSKDNQKSIMLKIYQGDNEVAAENEILGTFIFSGIREAPKSTVKVEVLFHIDSEGILTLTAKDKDTGQQMETILKVKGNAEEGDEKRAGKKDGSREVKSGKAAVRTVKKSEAEGGTAPAAPNLAEKKDDAAARSRAPWEMSNASTEKTAPAPQNAAGQKQKWYDPVFDKATRELPKDDVQKILAQAKAELEAEKAAAARTAAALEEVRASTQHMGAPAPSPSPSPAPAPAVKTTGQSPTGQSPTGHSPAGHSPAVSPTPSPAPAPAGSSSGPLTPAQKPVVPEPAEVKPEAPASAETGAASASTAVAPIEEPPKKGFFAWLLDLLMFWKKK